MSVANSVKKQILRKENGHPFTAREFLKLGSRKAVDCALARLIAENTITRVNQGIYMRPKSTQFVKVVAPDVYEVVKAVAARTGETIGMAGAEAAQRLKLSTQVPIQAMFYTTGSTRELTINNQRVKLRHVADRKLALAGKPAGMVLSALWYLGEGAVNNEVLNTITQQIPPSVLAEVESSNIPAWMTSAIQNYRSVAQST